MDLDIAKKTVYSFTRDLLKEKTMIGTKCPGVDAHIFRNFQHKQ